MHIPSTTQDRFEKGDKSTLRFIIYVTRVSISIDDSLHWLLSYNSFFIRNETVVLFQNSVMFIYDTCVI